MYQNSDPEKVGVTRIRFFTAQEFCGVGRRRRSFWWRRFFSSPYVLPLLLFFFLRLEQAAEPLAVVHHGEAEHRLVVVVHGILLFCFAISPGESAWRAVHDFLLGCLSWCAYLIGPLVVCTAVMIATDQSGYPLAAKLRSSSRAARVSTAEE